MTLVWLSPGLPADRIELADALPNGLTLVEPGPDHAGSGVDALPFGSLCVATVYEPRLLDRLTHRPDGVRLLVVAPPGAAMPVTYAWGRPVDATAHAGSVPELVTALRQAAGWDPPVVLPDHAAAAPPAAGRLRSWAGRWPAGIAGMLVGLAVGGVVIASTEGSAAGTAAGGRGAQFGPPGAGSTGIGGGAATFRRQLEACLGKQGITGDVDQLQQKMQSDPALREAFRTCLQQSGAGNGAAPSGTLPGPAGATPSSARTPSDLPRRSTASA